MFPKHVQNFIDNLSQVDQLMQIHAKIAGNTPGRKTNLETLNKSAIVLLTACWESFIEDLLSESFNFMLSKANKHDKIPIYIRRNIANQLKLDKHDLKVWELADDGWKKILTNYKDKILSDKLDYFHVPRPEKIDDLFKQLLDIDNITSSWKWKKMSNIAAKKMLSDFIEIRGAIAHKVKTSSSIRKKDVIQYNDFLNRVGILLHNTCTTHLRKITLTSPWNKFEYQDPKKL